MAPMHTCTTNPMSCLVPRLLQGYLLPEPMDGLHELRGPEAHGQHGRQRAQRDLRDHRQGTSNPTLLLPRLGLAIHPRSGRSPPRALQIAHFAPAGWPSFSGILFGPRLRRAAMKAMGPAQALAFIALELQVFRLMLAAAIQRQRQQAHVFQERGRLEDGRPYVLGARPRVHPTTITSSTPSCLAPKSCYSI